MIPEDEWKHIASVNELREGRGIVKIIDGEEIALFRLGDSFHAISNVCPHQHCPVLADGQLDGCVIQCPMHGWRFDVVSGKAVEASGRVRNFQLKMDCGELFVFIPENNSTW
jgi:nitrite reductase/ring-hydroxylating ferredoxin subunit